MTQDSRTASSFFYRIFYFSRTSACQMPLTLSILTDQRGSFFTMRLRRCFACHAFLGLSTAAFADVESLSTIPIITAPASDQRAGVDIATVDVTGIPSMGSPFDSNSNNVVLLLYVGPFNIVTGIGWDVVLQTLVPGSHLSDFGVRISNTALVPSNLAISPAAADSMPGGPTAYSRPMTKLADLGRPNVLALSDGLIRLEFFDAPDHAPGEADGLWVSGTLSFQTSLPVPAPAAASLLLLAGASALPRRRERKSA